MEVYFLTFGLITVFLIGFALGHSLGEKTGHYGALAQLFEKWFENRDEAITQIDEYLKRKGGK